jgi:DnaK suppressor protein
MKTSAPACDSTEIYRTMLVEKRSEMTVKMGAKFDTVARLGRVAEDDQAQLTHEEFVSLHLNSLDYLQLRMIEEALDRLDAGDYGICLSCDRPIAAKRLRAVCWARYCIHCQERVGNDLDREWAAESRRVALQPR